MNKDFELEDKFEAAFEAGDYEITPLEMWWLGLTSDLQLDYDYEEDLENIKEERTDRAAVVITDYEEFMDWIDEQLIQKKTGIRKIYSIMEWAKVFKSQKGCIVPDNIVKAWINNSLGTDVRKLANKLGIEHFRKVEDIENELTLVIADDIKKVEGAEVLTSMDLIAHNLVDLSFEEWKAFFTKVAVRKHDTNENVFALASMGYEVWIEWTDKDFKMINPNYTPREMYYFYNIIHPNNDCGTLVSAENCWGNFLVSLLKGGLTRDSLGRLLRQEATNLICPVQTYGNKSTYNEEVEKSKYGIIDVQLDKDFVRGVNLDFSNTKDPQATAGLYRFLNQIGTVSFPQHQGEDVRTNMAALAAGISLLKYNNIDMFIFERAVDKITKVFNRCALLNRVGTTGKLHIDLDDM